MFCLVLVDGSGGVVDLVVKIEASISRGIPGAATAEPAGHQDMISTSRETILTFQGGTSKEPSRIADFPL